MIGFFCLLVGILILILIVCSMCLYICFCVGIKSKKLERLCRPSPHLNPINSNWFRNLQCASSTLDSFHGSENDRQANTLAEETARDNRFNDIFFIEPNSAEAARIRAQLEKDDKDLPSYDEVMRMTNLATPTAAPATNSAFVPAISASSNSIAASSTSVNTTDTTLTVPPYTETGANVSSTSSIPRPLTPPPYSPEPPAANCVVLPITTALHATTTQSS